MKKLWEILSVWVAKSYQLYAFVSGNSDYLKCVLEVIAMEILLNIVTFKTLTYNYGLTVMSEEHLKILLSLRNSSGPRCNKNRI